MSEQIKMIACRIRNLREMLELTPQEVAVASGISPEEYLIYEQGEKDFSFSDLFNIAGTLGVDITDLLTGETPKLRYYVLTRAGEGLDFERSSLYTYQHLAFNFVNKKAEPFFVRVNYDPDMAEKEPNAHEGQEFDYVVSGSLKMVINGDELLLNPGDSIFYDSSYPHAMYALEGKDVELLAVVMK